MTPRVKEAPVLHCSCGAVLERDAARRTPFWHCTNLFCPKKVKKPKYFGATLVR